MLGDIEVKIRLAGLIPLLLVLSPMQAIAKQPQTPDVRPGTILYKTIANASPKERKGLNALLNSQGLSAQKALTKSGVMIATFKGKGRENAIANILTRSGLVEFAEPDYAVAPAVAPNDPSYFTQWHHNTINSAQAWDLTVGSNSVLVGVCDSGFDTDHPDLAANLRTDLAYNAQDDSTYVEDFAGHGTGTAGTIGAVGNNNTGMSGVNWNVDIIPVRIAISDTNSSAYISSMVKCIEYAADNGARVVNLSYGGIQFASIDAAAQYLRARNGLLFMSAGNSGSEYTNYPDYTSFVGVGATDQSNRRAGFSDWGDYVDLTAPGVNIGTTYLNGQYTGYSGTSFSAPVAAGVAALMVAVNPSITVDELETGLFSTAMDLGANGDDNVFGHGLVNAQAAVNYAINLGDYLAPVASISVTDNVVPFGSSVTLSGLDSADPDGNVVGYAWNLGDGTTSDQAELTHTFGAAGSYQVSLTVTDNDGLTNSTSTLIQVTNDVPVAVIDAMPGSYNIGEVAYFSGTGSDDTDGAITTYEWDFGDGTNTVGVTTSHVYASAGNYVATLTVTDNAGALNSTSVNITVSDPLALNAPDGLSAQTDGLAVTLNWNDNSQNEDSFVIERAVKYRGKVRFESVATASTDSTSYTDVAPEADNYWYRVTAVNSQNQATSASIKVAVSNNSTQPDPDPEPEPQPDALAAPTSLTVSQRGTTVTLSWADNSTSEMGFYVERGIKRKGKVSYQRIAVLGPDVTTATDDASALASGNYSYRVQAYNNNEVSGFSNSAGFRLK